MKVLLIEDEPNTVTYLCQGLREKGYAVDVAGSAEDGLSLARRLRRAREGRQRHNSG